MLKKGIMLSLAPTVVEPCTPQAYRGCSEWRDTNAEQIKNADAPKKYLLKSYFTKPFSKNFVFLNRNSPKKKEV